MTGNPEAGRALATALAPRDGLRAAVVAVETPDDAPVAIWATPTRSGISWGLSSAPSSRGGRRTLSR
jgi:hypothetical protein